MPALRVFLFGDTEIMDKEDAIREDAQETESKDVEQAEQRSNPRMDAMEEIAAKREQAMNEELGITEEAEQEEPEKPDAKEEPEEQKYRVKVDGEEMEVPLSEILRGYQKDSAASRRLEEAARRQKELDDREAALNARQSAVEQKIEPVIESKPVTTEALLDAIYDGNRDEAAKLFAEFAKGREIATPEQIDPTQVAALVKQQIVVEDALDKFAVDYSDVVKDPYLANLADSFLDAELKSGTHRTYSEALKAAGDKTRDWVKQIAPQQTPQDASRAEKLHRKEGMTTMPRSTAARSSTPEPVDEDSYRRSALEDTINRRQHRGR